MAGADARQVDARFRAQHAERELLLRHLEREHGHARAAAERRVRGDVQRERRLPHAGTCRDDDEVRRLEPGRQVIEVREARRDARDRLLLLVQLLDDLERVRHEAVHADEGGLHLTFGDLEDALLGAVEQVLHVARVLVAVRDDVGRRS
jgi:hypothetical protein